VNHVAVVERNHVYVDRVEWGATRAIVARIRERCILLSASVCSRGVVWIHPEFTADVQYNEPMQRRLRDLVLRCVRLTCLRR
jgi:hypothetical protein